MMLRKAINIGSVLYTQCPPTRNGATRSETVGLCIALRCLIVSPFQGFDAIEGKADVLGGGVCVCSLYCLLFTHLGWVSNTIFPVVNDNINISMMSCAEVCVCVLCTAYASNMGSLAVARNVCYIAQT